VNGFAECSHQLAVTSTAILGRPGSAILSGCWTVTDTNPGGEITVTRLDGHGTITLPVDDVRQYVQLAYSTTEHGAQGETAVQQTWPWSRPRSATTSNGQEWARSKKHSHDRPRRRRDYAAESGPL
jgi:hypothetical protein